jgi:hypothetical protein
MAEYAYPMDSKVTYNGNGIPSFDRAVTSAQLRGMISEIITNGVLMANNSNALRVIANGDKSVTIQPGLCVINGAIKKFTEAKTMQLPVSADTNYRCIAICALFDLTNRDIRLVYYNTYPAESATDLVPLNGKDGIDRSDTRYAIQLANIYTAPGSTRIVQSDITDTRLDTERCGAVSSISQFDTTNLYNQIQSDLASFKSTEQAEFQEWFENLQTVLDSNTAAHLQNEIDGLNSSKASKSDITNISITGSANNTGSTIPAGTLFYLNGTLCKTLADVASGATFTDGTNYASWSLKNTQDKVTIELIPNILFIDKVGKLCILHTRGTIVVPAGSYQSYSTIKEVNIPTGFRPVNRTRSFAVSNNKNVYGIELQNSSNKLFINVWQPNQLTVGDSEYVQFVMPYFTND